MITVRTSLLATWTASAAVAGAAAALTVVHHLAWLALLGIALYAGGGAVIRQHGLNAARRADVHPAPTDVDLEALADAVRETPVRPVPRVQIPPYTSGSPLAALLQPPRLVPPLVGVPRRPSLNAVQLDAQRATGKHAVELVATQTMPAVEPGGAK